MVFGVGVNLGWLSYPDPVVQVGLTWLPPTRSIKKQLLKQTHFRLGLIIENRKTRSSLAPVAWQWHCRQSTKPIELWREDNLGSVCTVLGRGIEARGKAEIKESSEKALLLDCYRLKRTSLHRPTTFLRLLFEELWKELDNGKEKCWSMNTVLSLEAITPNKR